MIEFYGLSANAASRSIIEICTTDPRGYAFVDSFLWATSKKKLPDEMSFCVAHGKRWTDIIIYHGNPSLRFFSQKIIDLLGTFLDMSDKCYPIHIEGTDQLYYVIYNLEEYLFLNQKYSSMEGKSPYFELPSTYPPLFTLANSNLRVCTKELKEALMKAKLTNVTYREVYGLTQDEKVAYMSIGAKKDEAAYKALAVYI